MKRIVIVGGGYGGVSALRTLSDEKDVHITLIDRHPYHFLQTEGYGLVAGTILFEETIVTLDTLCSGYGEHVSYLQEIVVDIDFESRRVICSDGKEVAYDYLIIAAGSVTRFMASVEGLQKCSHGVKSLRSAFEMKQFFEKELYLRLESTKDSQKVYSVVIGGAGLSGVEIAAEMQYYFNRYYHSNALACDTLQIHLISGGDTILKGMHPNVIAKAQKRLLELGVILHKGAHIEKVESDRAILENGEQILFDFMIFTGGIMAAPIVSQISLQHNRMGQVVVDADLQVPEMEGVFAVGDAAEIRDKHGHILPDTAQVAIKSGKYAAKNIIRMLQGKKTRPANIKIKGLAIALGGRYAIVDMGRIRIYGLASYFAKKITEKIYKWPLWMRCRVGYRKSHCTLEER